MIGEAPGADEDLSGKGFVGRAGRTLHRLLEAKGLQRGYDYGCANILRCRPPGNRKPTREEIENCLPHLAETLAQARPRVLLLVGATPTAVFCGPGALSVRVEEGLWGITQASLAHERIRDVIQGVRLFAMPHTSPLAWNRKAPDGRKWQAVGESVIEAVGRFLRTQSV
ncbi:uracil-DNA glycosylase [Acidithiobacillus ferrooxidans]|uniref:uracil-DNA glycosylase n=1 Tax=Acidithiobacillus ferrooxidans TaxID=920 RepID=UPI001C06E3D8|nr:uracil-DNA glycosylase [Acidithiobacillus ferrooxidans]MBU2774859.1 uracil-DNA glycosylase [Acidithiobacillus ferrooxidans]